MAILVPDEEFLCEFARARGKDPDLALSGQDPELHGALLPVVNQVNQGLPPAERIRRFMIASEFFTVENQMMTPTLKIRRHVITAAYGPALDRLY